MNILLSNFNPVKFDNVVSGRDNFMKNLALSDLVRIGSGYISADALIELLRTVEINNKPAIELLIGMHWFDGFTKTQYNAALTLHNFLIANQLGFVKLSRAMKFHGKIYSFHKDDKPFSCMLGSSNLSSLLSANKIYEIDYSLSTLQEILTADNYLQQITSKLGTNLDELVIENFNEYNPLLDDQYGVEKVSQQEVSLLFLDVHEYTFKIPIKTEPKSNLNVFFGKGRENARHFITPRPWYEVELIVSNSITSRNGYPRLRTFTVLTDDGWKFNCKTSGDYSKNFRSEDDLKILGKWLKGKLENSGALKIGEPVTKKVLDLYGSHNLELLSTSNPDIWLLKF